MKLTNNLFGNAKLAETIASASGWKLNTINAEHCKVPSVFVYVYDFSSEWEWCVSLPKSSFFKVLDLAKNEPSEGLPGFCSNLIELAANSNSLSADQENTLGIALSAYIGITQTYRMSDNTKKVNHFAVIRYRANEILRPIALKGPEKNFLPYPVVTEAIAQVIRLDKQNHPEWLV